MQIFYILAGSLRVSYTPLYISYLMPYLLAIILTQHYSGSLLSYLTVKQAKIPFNNLEGIIQDGSYKLSLLNGTYNLFYFYVSKINF